MHVVLLSDNEGSRKRLYSRYAEKALGNPQEHGNLALLGDDDERGRQIRGPYFEEEFLNQREAAESVLQAIERVLADGSVRTPDMGGAASTQALGRAVTDAL